MIEIEIFQREKSCGVHTLKIWTNGNLTHANEIFKSSQLYELRDDLHNELLWLNSYLDDKGSDECQHESDGNTFLSIPPQYKCKKCEEFYR